MKKILFILCFLSFKVYAQEPTYVPMKSNYLFRGIKHDSLVIMPVYPDTPTATTKVNFAGSVVRVGSKLYMRNPQLTKWVDLSDGGGVATDTTSLSNRINAKADTSALALKLNKSDSTLYQTKFRSDTSRTNIYGSLALKMAYNDTVSLSNRINDKIDSLRRVGIQVSFKKNGIWYNAYTDSTGGQNGRWGNDTALIVMAKVHNATGTQLNRGEVVYLSGANGDVASVKRANNKYDSTSATTIGMVKDNIASGDTGWVVTQGQISKINTAAFTSGDIVYIDSVDGQFTKSKPQAPYHMVFLGVVEKANAGNGQIYIKPINGYEIGELHDVRIISPINNQVLVYSDTQQLWKNRNVYSVVDTTGLSNRINAKLNISDTASMLSPYLRKADTASLSNRINLKLNISDTATMLNPYLRKADTSSLSNRINTKLNTSDSSIYQPKYRSDTMRTSLYTSLSTKLSTSDSTIYFTRYRSDTMRTNIYNQLAQEVNVADTATMLRNYQRTSSFPVATFGAGSGAAGDTSAFTTSAIYGSFYLNAGSDTIIVTGYTGVVQGTSASVTPTIYFNDSLNVTAGATKIVNSPSAVTSTTTGNTVTSLDNTKIPPGNFVWVKTETVTTKPTYFNLTLIGYRKR